jgi:hypothetical protein
MTRYEDYYDPDLHGVNEDEDDRCPNENGGADECIWCKYYHDPCFPEFNEDDEE